MARLIEITGGLVWRRRAETLRIEPWGSDAIRVRGTLWRDIPEDRVGALLPGEPPAICNIEITETVGRVQVGRLTCEIDVASGKMAFFRDGAPSVHEKSSYLIERAMPGRRISHGEGELLDIDLEFESNADERFFGMGQNPTGALNLKGNRLDLRQRNGYISVPFVVSSRNYGFFWNNAAIGDVSFDTNRTRWRARGAASFDYWITAGDDQKDIVRRYTRATGLSPRMPRWGTGFWQSRLRYATRDELTEVVDTHLGKGYQMSVVVIDYFHWSKQGEWKFHEPEWPNMQEAVANFETRGVKTMVSVWPSVSIKAETYPEMKEQGYLLRARKGLPFAKEFFERGEEGGILISYYDATNPEARKYVWDRCKENYYDKGINIWWLDASEPEIYPEFQENLLYHAGAGSAVSNAYPLFNAQAFYEGMRSEGEDEIVLLSRSAWAGNQRYGTIIWPGDVNSRFSVLKDQIRLALNAATSGLSWWSTDIGGFTEGVPEDPEFRELLVRWFQFGVFVPVCRLHGNREPTDHKYGGPNELWSFGPEVERLLAEQLQIREDLREYIQLSLDQYSAEGTPFMRSLEMEFPEDPGTIGQDDSYMFGDLFLVAPIVEYRARRRDVYLPAGASWVCHWTGREHAGGQTVEADAPLDRIPVFKRVNSEQDPVT